MNFFKRYYCIKQHDEKDCGVACLATILRKYGLKVSLAKIREIAGTDKEGTSAYGIIKAAEEIGLTSKGIKVAKFEDIYDDFPKPAIAHVIIEKNLMHYVVIYKATEKEIVVADPAKGIVKYTPEEFFKIWTKVLLIMVPSNTFKKGNETKGLFKRFWYLISTQKSILIKVFISSIIITVLGIIAAFYSKILIDYVVPNELNKELLLVSIVMIVLVIFKVLIEFLRSILLVYMSQNIDTSLLLGYYNHVINLPMKFFGTRKVGEIISRFNDAGKIRDAISSAALTLMIDMVMAVVGGVILYSQSSKLFLYCVIPVVLYLILVVSFKNIIDEVNNKVMEDNSKITSYLVESIEGIETVKSFNGEKRVHLETKNRFMKFIKSLFKYSYVNNVQGTLKGAVKSIFGIYILGVGAYYSIKGDITIGTVISFNMLLVYFIEPIERVINLQSVIQSAIVAADRLGDILDLELEKNIDERKKMSPKTLVGDIQFKNVNFRYGTRKLVLKDIKMKINHGEKIALVGESGSGKTTIAKLLMNFYDVEDGEILINSYNIKDINKEVLRNKISYISQETFFFSGTIKDNLKFANEFATDEEIIDACKKANIHEFIDSTIAKYETLLEEKGTNLSGGQRQRLAIARALLKKPEILIMDEATSNLDSITEKAIEGTIEKSAKGITTIIIAHRLSTIMKCDKIYVMDKGIIVEEGTHEELINKGGYYFNLWRAQITGNVNV